MSLSTSLSAAISGLNASSRGALTVSSNIANAQTEGYGRRNLALVSNVVGPGIRVSGEVRQTDSALLSDLRTARSDAAASSATLDFSDRALDLIGSIDAPDSLGVRVAALKTSLIAATATPEDSVILGDVVEAADALARKFNSISDGLQSLRGEADAGILKVVNRVNGQLAALSDLNISLRKAGSLDDAQRNGFLDQQERLLSELSESVKINIVSDPTGAITLYSTTGVQLLGSRPSILEFTPTARIEADMTLESGALSSIFVNGREVSSTMASNSLPGGELAALFALRDGSLPKLQKYTDMQAADLIDRVSDPNIDPTLSIGDPGIFTDAGGAFSGTEIDGLAGRLNVNPSLSLGSSNDNWRIRDGIAASVPGQTGDASIIISLQAAIFGTDSDNLTNPSRTSGLGIEVINEFQENWRMADRKSSQALFKKTLLDAAQAKNGVSTDAEMQRLLQIEQAYLANAKVIQTVDSLLRTLTEL